MTKLTQNLHKTLLVTQLRQLNFSFHSVVAREPQYWLLHQPYIWWSQYKKQQRGIHPQESIVGTHTELVIDGFQGSANSFATQAFKLCQTQPVTLAHHLHSAAQIIKAAQLNIPILLTIREPVGAVLSLTSRWPYVSLKQALESYIAFYSKLEPHASDCVISTFDQTTQHLDDVVERINKKFGTHFDLIDVVKSNTELRDKINHNPDPKAKSLAIKKETKEKLMNAKYNYLLNQAETIYTAFENLV